MNIVLPAPVAQKEGRWVAGWARVASDFGARYLLMTGIVL